jgi:hypothetical protein
MSRQLWVDRFGVPGDPGYTPYFQTALAVLAGKGGDKLSDAVRFTNGTGATGLIVCVNAFTDTPASAGAFAEYAKAHGIRVLAWQLANEANLRQFRSFFSTGSDYAAKMRPFAAAIKGADPSAQVALFVSNASFPDSAWDNALASFRPRYWDLITYHQYPLLFVNTAADLMAQLNAELAVNSSDYLETQIVPRFGRMPVVITEAAPGFPGTGNMFGTLYGGIWRLNTLFACLDFRRSGTLACIS